MTEIAEKKKGIPGWLKLSAKILVTALCFWYISGKIDFESAKNAFFEANWWWLGLALSLLTLSKLFSSFRLNIYFRNIGLSLSEALNLRLYWLGMFYNLFLPGAISGDAYKVILLNRHYQTSYKKASAAVLLDRFSGLLALGLILAVYGWVILPPSYLPYLLLVGAVVAVGVLYWVTRRFFPEFTPGFWPTFVWGLAVQGVQVICIYTIMAALGIPATQHEWIFIFLAAAVISVLPLSLGGGLGTREFVFVEGARFFHLSEETGLVISLLFYLISVVASLPGLYYVFREPLGRQR